MKLGTYVEVLNYVDDTAAAGAYYSKLGLSALGDDVYTDGRYHLRLLAGEGENPSLRYFGSDIDALKSSGLAISDNMLTSPTGVKILLDAKAPPRQLPHDNVAQAPDITRLGQIRRAFSHDRRFGDGRRILGSRRLPDAGQIYRAYALGHLVRRHVPDRHSSIRHDRAFFHHTF